ncbi:hypothetical protein Nepgr_006668 [Nepenthes gracilis]|uniref:Uncharacterized protein n=1 Tax=Nepenthes gracilis TaxID=150966 RepID=A0AAD3XHK6_NEPGR|nr:hypothetical protein Nepgr_006668 [Nepenthes gracilis]
MNLPPGQITAKHKVHCCGRERKSSFPPPRKLKQRIKKTYGSTSKVALTTSSRESKIPSQHPSASGSSQAMHPQNNEKITQPHGSCRTPTWIEQLNLSCSQCRIPLFRHRKREDSPPQQDQLHPIPTTKWA